MAQSVKRIGSILILSFIFLSMTAAYYPIPLPGTSGNILTSNGTKWLSSAPSISLTTGVSGVLPIANGGTNNGSLAVTDGGVIVSDGTKLINTGAGTAGQFLKSNGTSDQTFAWGAQVAAIFTFGTVADISTTSTSATFATTGSWVGPTVTYNNSSICSAQTTDADGPRVTCNNALAGAYTIDFSGVITWGRNDTTNKNADFYCSDGTTTYMFTRVRNGSVDDMYPIPIICKFYYSSSGSRSWDIRILTESGGTTRYAGTANAPIFVHYSPAP